MGIIRKDTNDVSGLKPIQVGVLSILDEYGYEIADLRLIEELDQIVVTIRGMVLFVRPSDVTISFEINTTPDIVANLILILATIINPSDIHVTDSFVITLNPKGEKIAVFGKDAQEVYEKDLATANGYNDKRYYDILTSPNIKFYEC